MNKELSKKERDVAEAFLKKTKLPKAKSGRKFVIGMIGLAGSGKSAVATQLAREIGAVVVRGDNLRVELRKKKTLFKHVLEMEYYIVSEILSRGGSVVVDSDFADVMKRNGLKKVAKDGGAQTHFVRVVADYDVIFGRIMTHRFGTKAKDIFTGFKTSWKGVKKPAVVKLRTMWRRTPHHYTWAHDEGGRWVQKTIQDVYATVDTTSIPASSKKVKEVAKRILRTR